MTPTTSFVTAFTTSTCVSRNNGINTSKLTVFCETSYDSKMSDEPTVVLSLNFEISRERNKYFVLVNMKEDSYSYTVCGLCHAFLELYGVTVYK